MRATDIDEWTETLLERIKVGNSSLDFTGLGLATRRRKTRKVFTVDKVRTRQDGLFDRLFLEYEFFKPTENADVWLSEIRKFGWLIRVQYAVNRHEECPIPSIRDGGYCNLFDLTEYVRVSHDFVDAIGSFPLGEESYRIAAGLAELGDFLARAIPVFMEEKIRPRLG